MTGAHRNNFDSLRFLAATLVWYAHCLRFYDMPDSITGRFAGRYAVDVFFVISGYFVTASFVHHRKLLPFLKNRGLRIFPALIAIVLLTVFVLGPCVTTLTLHEYFTAPLTWNYLKWAAAFTAGMGDDFLPGVFTGNHFHDINFSLWTLRYELYCYLMIALLGVLNLLRAPVMAGIILLCALASVRLDPFGDLTLLFSAGALLYLLRDRIALRWEFFAFSVLLSVVAIMGFQSLLAYEFCIPYAIIYLGFAHIPGLQRFSARGDFSYGMYLYAFPVQQLVLYMLGKPSFPLYLLLTFSITFACAVASWHFIEKPALRRKERG